MNQYIVRTPTIVVNRPPYELVDRVFVVAANPDQAVELAVQKLRESGAEYIFACMIEGKDPSEELIVLEHRMGVSHEPFAFTDPKAFDLHAAAKASSTAIALEESERQLRYWKAGFVALFIVFLLVGFMALTALNMKAENDRGETTLMEQNR